MIVTTDTYGIPKALARLGAADVLQPSGSAVIEINLPRPPDPDRPRTHPDLIRAVVSAVRSHGAPCAIAEGCDGFLERSIERIGLADFVKENDIELIDLDLVEDVEMMDIGGLLHYVPRCLADFTCRIAIPATTWLPDMIFSNNVKLFVGAVPREFYRERAQDDRSARWRVHIGLHQSVADIYRAIRRTVCAAFDIGHTNSVLGETGRG